MASAGLRASRIGLAALLGILALAPASPSALAPIGAAASAPPTVAGCPALPADNV